LISISVKNVIGILMGTALFTMLILLIHKHGSFLHFLMSSWFSFFSNL
jgi:hypothetical protein